MFNVWLTGLLNCAVLYCTVLKLFCFVFPSEVILHLRVIRACPVTTDCIVAMTSCENNYNYYNYKKICPLSEAILSPISIVICMVIYEIINMVIYEINKVINKVISMVIKVIINSKVIGKRFLRISPLNPQETSGRGK